MPFAITFITNEGKVVNVAEKANLLRTSIREKGGIPFKCGAGICGTCKCKIESGLAVVVLHGFRNAKCRGKIPRMHNA